MKILPIANDAALSAWCNEAIEASGIVDARPQPTHAMIDQCGNLGGSCALFGPTAFVWFNPKWKSKQGRARSVALIEQTIRDSGHKEIILLLHRDSPLYPFAGRVGYLPLASVELFHKSLPPCPDSSPNPSNLSSPPPP